MSKISLDKDLTPGEKVEFDLELTIFGETLSRQISFLVTNAPPLANKQSDKLKLTVENKDEYSTGNNKSYGFNKFKKFTTNISPTRYKFLVILNSDKIPGDLSPEDDVLITCAEAGFTNVPAVVLPSENKRKNYLYLSISTANQPSKTSDTSTVGTVTEVKKRIKKRKITVNAICFRNTLVSKSVPLKKGSVEDIIVFAYKQFEGENKASIKYKLMGDDSEINLKTPPVRSKVAEDRGKYTKTKMFKLNDENGSKILCFVAIARYTYDGDNWKGEWLQTNEENNVIWGRAG